MLVSRRIYSLHSQCPSLQKDRVLRLSWCGARCSGFSLPTSKLLSLGCGGAQPKGKNIWFTLKLKASMAGGIDVDGGSTSHKHTNRLAKEHSPYLLQHAHNPVDWYPWGEEAFAKAREEDKPIFLSGSSLFV